MTTTDWTGLLRVPTAEDDRILSDVMSVVGAHQLDIHQVYAERRKTMPVMAGDIIAELGGNSALMMHPADSYWTLFSHADVTRVLRDWDTFSSAELNESLGRAYGRTILTMDPPEHPKARSMLTGVFNKRALEEWRRTLFQPVIEAYVDSVVPRGRCELNREVLLQFPVTILHALMGLPDEPDKIDRFHHLAQSLFLVRGPNPQEGMAAASELAAFFDEIVANHRAGIDTGVASDGIVSSIIRANDEVGVLTDDEIAGFLRMLLPAGAETTTKSSGNLLIGLLRARQWDELVADPSLINAAVEGGLRWETAAPTVYRVTKRAVEVGGTMLPAGAGINALVTSANRDEARFADPNRFDIHRSDGGHVGLGFGIHLCLGHQMARLEIRTLLDVLVRKMPRLRLDEEVEPPSIHGLTLRFPDRVPVRWD